MKTFFALISSFLAVCLGIACLLAQEETDVPENVDAKAAEVLRDMARHLSSAETLRFTQQSSLSVAGMEDKGLSEQMTVRSKVTFERPNKLAMEVEQGEFGITTISDGKTMTSYVPAMKKYAVEDAPESLDAHLASTSGMAFMQGADLITPALLHSDPYKSLLDGVTGGKYLGLKELDGNKCHHLQFTQEEVDWEVWIDAV